MNKDRRICLGVVAGAHGLDGGVKVRTFTEVPENVAAYGQVEDEARTRTFTLVFVRRLKPGLALVRAREIAGREDAARLRGTRLYVRRDVLPPTEDEDFYVEDLIGLEAVAENGAPLGKVAAVHDFGAGAVLELSGFGRPLLIRFAKTAVPRLDFGEGRLVVAREAVADALG